MMNGRKRLERELDELFPIKPKVFRKTNWLIVMPVLCVALVATGAGVGLMISAQANSQLSNQMNLVDQIVARIDSHDKSASSCVKTRHVYHYNRPTPDGQQVDLIKKVQ